LPKQYQIIPTKTFLKDLEKKVNPPYARQIEKVIDKLAKNPYQGIKLISIKIGQWRIRIGDYRIRYDIVFQLFGNVKVGFLLGGCSVKALSSDKHLYTLDHE